MTVSLGIRKRLLPVPWNEPCAVVEEGLWSISSRAPKVRRPLVKLSGQATPSCLNRLHSVEAKPLIKFSTLSYETLMPSRHNVHVNLILSTPLRAFQG